MFSIASIVASYTMDRAERGILYIWSIFELEGIYVGNHQKYFNYKCIKLWVSSSQRLNKLFFFSSIHFFTQANSWNVATLWVQDNQHQPINFPTQQHFGTYRSLCLRSWRWSYISTIKNTLPFHISPALMIVSMVLARKELNAHAATKELCALFRAWLTF